MASQDQSQATAHAQENLGHGVDKAGVGAAGKEQAAGGFFGTARDKICEASQTTQDKASHLTDQTKGAADKTGGFFKDTGDKMSGMAKDTAEAVKNKVGAGHAQKE